MEWSRWNGPGGMVQVEWSRWNGPGGMVQVEWSRWNGSGGMVQVFVMKVTADIVTRKTLHVLVFTVKDLFFQLQLPGADMIEPFWEAVDQPDSKYVAIYAYSVKSYYVTGVQISQALWQSAEDKAKI